MGRKGKETKGREGEGKEERGGRRRREERRSEAHPLVPKKYVTKARRRHCMTSIYTKHQHFFLFV